MIENWMYEKLKRDIGVGRYNHSLLVMETSVELAKFYNCSIEEAKLAGLLHDCGKFQDKTKILKTIAEFDIILDNIMEKNIALAHGPLGEFIAKEKYNIQNENVLNAIRYHTTGRENMSLLEKIVFIADLIESSRKFPGVEEMRKLAYENLNKAIILALDNNIQFVIKRNNLLHLDTVRARNYLLISEDME
ncbi:MAG: HD domain-containing protein [Tissierellia bacterium]|nr:HD domain-containing protein [Tissierellia bacterium]